MTTINTATEAIAQPVQPATDIALNNLLCQLDSHAGNGMIPWRIEDAFAKYQAALAQPAQPHVITNDDLRNCFRFYAGWNHGRDDFARYREVLEFYEANKLKESAELAALRAQRVPMTRQEVQGIVINVCKSIWPEDSGFYSESDAVFYSAFASAVEAFHRRDARPETGLD